MNKKNLIEKTTDDKKFVLEENALKKNETELAGVTDIDTLSEEERNKIFEEMADMFSQQSDDRKISFDISKAPRGVNFPVIFNMILIVVVIGAITSTTFFLNTRDKQLFNSYSAIQERTGAALSQKIIEEGQAEKKKLEDELNNLKLEQENLAATLAANFENLQSQLANQLSDNQAKLRRELEAQNISEAEIKRRLNEQKSKLNREHQAKLAKYKAQQEADKKAKEEAYQKQIAEKETLIKEKETELATTNQEIQSQLSNTENTLRQLQIEKEARKKAYLEFNVYHQNIVNLVKNNNFTRAKTDIEIAKNFIDRSPYRNEPESQTYINAYATYTVMIDAAIAADTILTGSASDIEALSLNQNEAQAQIVELTEKIAQLTQNNEDLQNNLSTTQNQLDSSKRSAVNLTNKLTTLEEKHNRLVAANASSTQMKIIREESLNEILNNVRVIVTYLGLMTTGYDDPATKQFILKLKNEQALYGSIIDSMLDVMDPKGIIKQQL